MAAVTTKHFGAMSVRCKKPKFVTKKYIFEFSRSQAIPVEPHVIFKTSFFFYSLFGAIMTVIFGLVISYVTTADPPVDENLLSPVCRFRKLEREAEGTYLSVEEALQTLEK